MTSTYSLIYWELTNISVVKALSRQVLVPPSDLKSIKITKPTYERIAKEITVYGETMDQILDRLLNELDECRRKHIKK
jgi:hypothetical protein